MKQHKTYLAFDYGTVRTGMAVGEDLTCCAEPLKPLRMKHGWADEEQLADVIIRWQPDAFVIGMPDIPNKHNKGEINIAARAQSFAAYLNRKFTKPCYFTDERLTSRLMEVKQKEEKDKVSLDSRVAQALLCEWLCESTANTQNIHDLKKQ